MPTDLSRKEAKRSASLGLRVQAMPVRTVVGVGLALAAGGWLLTRTSAGRMIPAVLGGGVGYFAGKMADLDNHLVLGAAVIGAGSGFLIGEQQHKKSVEAAEEKEKADTKAWCKEHDWWALVSPSCYADVDLAGDNPYDANWDYPCIWEGATDDNSEGSVSTLIGWLMDEGFTPPGMKAKPRTPQTFTAAVTAAVKKFQQARGMKADGVVGPEFWNEIAPWVTAGRKGNCPRCAGNFKYGEPVPIDCQKNIAPTREELERRAAESDDPTKTGKRYGLDEEEPPEEGEDKLSQKRQIPWLMISGISLAVLGTAGLVLMRKRRAS